MQATKRQIWFTVARCECDTGKSAAKFSLITSKHGPYGHIASEATNQRVDLNAAHAKYKCIFLCMSGCVRICIHITYINTYIYTQLERKTVCEEQVVRWMANGESREQRAERRERIAVSDWSMQWLVGCWAAPAYFHSPGNSCTGDNNEIESWPIWLYVAIAETINISTYVHAYVVCILPMIMAWVLVWASRRQRRRLVAVNGNGNTNASLTPTLTLNKKFHSQKFTKQSNETK